MARASVSHASVGSPNAPRLFAAGLLALVALAMTFAIRADILADLGQTFDIGHARQGLVFAAVTLGYPVTVLMGAALCDRVGMRLLVLAGCLGHCVGIGLTIASPSVGFWCLLLGSLVIGLSDGLVESVLNPLIAALYPKDRTGMINALHAAWPAGLIVGGAICLVGMQWSWQARMATVFIPVLAYGGLVLGQAFPRTEAAVSGHGTGVMLRAMMRPGFLLLAGCMICTAITEVGPDQWIGSVMTDTTGIRGITFLMYTAAIMVILRLLGGRLARGLSPFGLLAGSCAVAGAGLLWLSVAFSPVTAFAAATVFAIGKTTLWPTLLGIVADRHPKAGPIGLALLGAVGMLACGAAGPLLGAVYDHETIVRLPPGIAAKVIVDGRLSPVAAESLNDPTEQSAIRAATRDGAAMTFRRVALVPLLPLAVCGWLAWGGRRRKRRQ